MVSAMRPSFRAMKVLMLCCTREILVVLPFEVLLVEWLLSLAISQPSNRLSLYLFKVSLPWPFVNYCSLKETWAVSLFLIATDHVRGLAFSLVTTQSVPNLFEAQWEKVYEKHKLSRCHACCPVSAVVVFVC